jgi:hypothetical protein
MLQLQSCSAAKDTDPKVNPAIQQKLLFLFRRFCNFSNFVSSSFPVLMCLMAKEPANNAIATTTQRHNAHVSAQTLYHLSISFHPKT